MTVRLEIFAETAHMFEADFDPIARAMGYVKRGEAVHVAVTPPATPAPAEAPAPVAEAEIVPPKKRGPKPKAEDAPKVIDIDTNGDPVKEDAPAEEAPAISVEAIRDKLLVLSKKKGADKVWGILKGAGVEGASDALKKNKGADILAKAQEAFDDDSIPNVEGWAE